jgi:hypothetical protein
VQSRAWRTWWSQVPRENLARATRWMSGVDLGAFLDGIEEYARVTANDAMQRMLERRKRLLTGLFEQDLVEDVRLVLGSDIRWQIQRSTRLDLRDVARLQDPGKHDTAVIYLDCGDFSLIEGSHNFKLHIYLGGGIPALADRSVTVFDGDFLRDTVPARHRAVHGAGSHRAVPHLGGDWIRKTLDFLASHGVDLDETGLMTPEDYDDLVSRRAQAWS